MSPTIPAVKVEWKRPIVIIELGSIGKALLPLISRHIGLGQDKIFVIDPDDGNKYVADQFGAIFLKIALTALNYKEVILDIIRASPEQAIIVNVSVDVATSKQAQSQVYQFAPN